MVMILYLNNRNIYQNKLMLYPTRLQNQLFYINVSDTNTELNVFRMEYLSCLSSINFAFHYSNHSTQRNDFETQVTSVST